MVRFFSTVALATLAVAIAVPVTAQQDKKRASPHEKVMADIDGNKITLEYGRPYAKRAGTDKVRKIWGGLVPYGKPWRTGADEATQLTITQPITVGKDTIAAGTYTLYTIPEESGGKLVFSKTVGKWGVPVDTKNDLVQVDMKKDTVKDMVDQFTMAIEKGTGGGGVLKMTWENAQYSVPFMNAKK